MTISIDFANDWKHYVEGYIASQGYAVDTCEELRSLSYKFFNIQNRRIRATPRKVFESSTFSCPADLASGYAVLKKKLEDGHDVCTHLSKSLLKDNYEDSLLNDWGIHHFHLGEKLEISGFIERTGPLLFAYVTVNSIFCLGVYPHGAWSEKGLIQVLHDNWPSLISTKKINGINNLSQASTNDDIAKLRKAGVNVLIEVAPGIVYVPLGGGYSTAGTSVKSTIYADNTLQLLRKLEEYIKENIDEFTASIIKQGCTLGSALSFSLIIDEEGFKAVEKGSGIKFLLHSHEG